jgi:signal transduction histidine kinase
MSTIVFKRDTGLRLPASYNIIKKHGGDSIFTSELGKGSIATVTLPVAF